MVGYDPRRVPVTGLAIGCTLGTFASQLDARSEWRRGGPLAQSQVTCDGYKYGSLRSA